MHHGLTVGNNASGFQVPGLAGGKTNRECRKTFVIAMRVFSSRKRQGGMLEKD
jgi:hypothetical protein